MLSLIIWWASLFLELAILFRLFQQRVVPIYPYFSSYILSVFCSSLALYFIYTSNPLLYSKWYWIIEFPTLILGCGIILEILKHVLSPYPGAERFASIGGIAVFGCAFGLAIFSPMMTGVFSLARSFESVERDLRAVQALLLFGAIGIVGYYRIALGRNLKGMILGYAVYIGTSLINLALRAYAGAPVNAIWSTIQPFAFDVCLLIWAYALWAYEPNPTVLAPLSLEDDYEIFVSRTRHALSGMRSHLAKVPRS